MTQTAKARFTSLDLAYRFYAWHGIALWTVRPCEEWDVSYDAEDSKARDALALVQTVVQS